jgi:hypothetical protein
MTKNARRLNPFLKIVKEEFTPSGKETSPLGEIQYYSSISEKDFFAFTIKKKGKIWEVGFGDNLKYQELLGRFYK